MKTNPKLTRWRCALGVALVEASVVACGGGAANVTPPLQPAVPSADGQSSDALPAPGTYELDPPHTFIVWSAKHRVVGSVRGRFDKIGGTLVVAQDPAACTADVTIEAPSISTQTPVRDEDLRSPGKPARVAFRGHADTKRGDFDDARSRRRNRPSSDRLRRRDRDRCRGAGEAAVRPIA